VVATEATELLVVAVEDYRRHLQVSHRKEKATTRPRSSAAPPENVLAFVNLHFSPCYVRSWRRQRS
jgi:hypothetical protein